MELDTPPGRNFSGRESLLRENLSLALLTREHFHRFNDDSFYFRHTMKFGHLWLLKWLNKIQKRWSLSPKPLTDFKPFY